MSFDSTIGMYVLLSYIYTYIYIYIYIVFSFFFISIKLTTGWKCIFTLYECVYCLCVRGREKSMVNEIDHTTYSMTLV
jgi:hypothetical protein